MTAVLSINAGSSSIKFGLFDLDRQASTVLRAKGTLEDTGPLPRLDIFDAAGVHVYEQSFAEDSSREEIFGVLLEQIDRQLAGRVLAAVGHRVVHGGLDFDAPVVVDEEALAAIGRLVPLAPLHQTRSLGPMRAIRGLRPEVPQVACFDTSFHRDLQPPITRYAIPRRYERMGIRKYGFHGLSYGFIARRLAEMSPELAAGRTVVAHLGNGASLCAMQHGRSVDTTMGFSALDGLVMGTRCGTLDPGVVLYLQETHGLTVEQVEDVLYHQSGLLGVSGLSSDMRVLVDSTDPNASEAIDLFCFRVSRETAAMANTLAGLDCLVFTGGIGEHSPRIRAEICRRLGWLGVDCDLTKNDSGEDRIDGIGSRVKILIVPTNEEAEIARFTAAAVTGRTSVIARLRSSGLMDAVQAEGWEER